MIDILFIIKVYIITKEFYILLQKSRSILTSFYKYVNMFNKNKVEK